MRYSTLTQVNPWREMASLQAEVNRFLEGGSPRNGDRAFAPAIDLLRNDEQIIVRADVPGLTRDNLEITVLNNRLFIRGEKRQNEASAEGTEQRSERRFGRFERAIDLPGRVNPEAVKASLADGVLEITAPLQEEAKPRRIPLEVK